MTDFWFGTQSAVGGGGGGAQPGFVLPSANTITAVRAALEDGPEPAGVKCNLMNAAGTLVAGTWTSDGAGGSVCREIDWGLVDSGSATVGDADTFDIEIDTGSSLSFSAAGITPLAGVATKIVYHCLGEASVANVNSFDSQTSQTIDMGTVVNDVLYGGGFWLPRPSVASLILASFIGYSTTGATWRSSAGYNLWPSPTIGLGIPVTLDTDGKVTSTRSPRGDGASSQSLLLVNGIGDAVGPNAGAPTQISAATDGWSQAGRQSIPASFYDPQTSDLTYTIRTVSFIG